MPLTSLDLQTIYYAAFHATAGGSHEAGLYAVAQAVRAECKAEHRSKALRLRAEAHAKEPPA